MEKNNIMLMRLPLALITLAAITLAGCQSAEAPARGRADTTDHRRVFFSKEDGRKLESETRILAENLSRDQFGLVTAVVPIRSAGTKTLYLEYQYEFFDQSGRRIEGPLGWTAVTVEAGAPATIQFTSTSPTAADYRVTIRRAR